MTRIILTSERNAAEDERRFHMSSEPVRASVSVVFHPADLAYAQAAFDRCVADIRRQLDILTRGAQ